MPYNYKPSLSFYRSRFPAGRARIGLRNGSYSRPIALIPDVTMWTNPKMILWSTSSVQDPTWPSRSSIGRYRGRSSDGSLRPRLESSHCWSRRSAYPFADARQSRWRAHTCGCFGGSSECLARFWTETREWSIASSPWTWRSTILRGKACRRPRLRHRLRLG